MARVNGEKFPVIADVEAAGLIPEEGQSSESITTNVCSCNSGPPPEDDCSDTSLKLGYA